MFALILLFSVYGAVGGHRNDSTDPASLTLPIFANNSSSSSGEDPPPIHGPYRFQVKHETLESDLFDRSDQGLEVWYPDIAGKLIAYPERGETKKRKLGYFCCLSEVRAARKRMARHRRSVQPGC